MTLQRLIEQIRIEHGAAAGAARSALDHARRAGELLNEAKQQTDHGAWLPWLRQHFDFTPRTAQGYMRIAERWSELQGKSETVSHLGLREALALLSPAKELQPHEYSLIFPAMNEAEFEGLKDSLRRNGYIKQCGSITLYEGKILDGKERYRACLDLGIEPVFETYEEVIERGHYRGSPRDFVMSCNRYRQCFTETQRAVAAVRFEEMQGEAAYVC